MTLVLIAELRARPGCGDEVLRALTAMIEPSVNEPGCLSYRPLLDPAAEDTVLCLEEWKDEAALQAHFATTYFTEVAVLLERLLAEPFTLRRLSPEADR